MNALPVSLIYTQDALLFQRIQGYLHARASVQLLADPLALEQSLHQHKSTLLFVDLCATDAVQLIKEKGSEFPAVLMIALGAVRSDPALLASATGVYAVESAEVGRLRLQSLFEQAQTHLRLLNENRVLRETVQNAPEPPPFRAKTLSRHSTIFPVRSAGSTTSASCLKALSKEWPVVPAYHVFPCFLSPLIRYTPSGPA